MMGIWRSSTRSGQRTAERTALVAAGFGLVAAVVVGVWMGTGSGTQSALIEDAPQPTTVQNAFTPRPQSGPVVELIPDELGQPDPAAPSVAEPDIPEEPPATVAGGSTPAARVEEALRLIAYDWRNRLPGWTIEISGPRSGLMGLTRTAERQIEIYVRPSMSTDALAHVLAHEIAHAVDVTYLDAAERSAFQVVRGRAAGSRWWAENARSDFATGAGDWAEAFAFMVTGGRGAWSSQLGPPPNIAQQAAMREFIV